MSKETQDFPQLTTTRCILRKIERSDQQSIFEGLSDPAVIKHYGVSYLTFEETAAQMDFYDELLRDGTGIWWAVCLKETKAFMGACGFNNWRKEHRKAEIGFWLLPPFQRKGYMSEAVGAIIRHAFHTMNIHRIEAIVEPGNHNSIRLLTQLNFTHEGTFKDAEIKHGRFIDLAWYRRLKTDL